MTSEPVEELSDALVELIEAVQRTVAAVSEVIADPQSREQVAQAWTTLLDTVAASVGGKWPQ